MAKKKFKPTQAMIYSTNSVPVGNFTPNYTATWTQFKPHFIITQDAKLVKFVPTSKEGVHDEDFDVNTIAIAYIGGRSVHTEELCDTLGKAQEESLRDVLDNLRKQFGKGFELINTHPDHVLHPHFNVYEKFGIEYCDPEGRTPQLDDSVEPFAAPDDAVVDIDNESDTND